MRTTTYIGLILGFGAVFLAIKAKGGDMSIFTNVVALLVCVGGTFAATTLSSSRMTALHAFSAMKQLFWAASVKSGEVAEQLVELAKQGKSRGLASIDPEQLKVPDPFLRKGLHLVVDGVDPARIENLLRLESDILTE